MRSSRKQPPRFFNSVSVGIRATTQASATYHLPFDAVADPRQSDYAPYGEKVSCDRLEQLCTVRRRYTRRARATLNDARQRDTTALSGKHGNVLTCLDPFSQR
jgi:hypothetical protein